MPDAGMVSLACDSSVAAVTDRLSALIEAKGLKLFARVDHAANAAEVGMALRPTILLIFGHPRGGTPLMQDRQTAGLDLPIRALVWEDEAGAVWLTYNDPMWLVQRHGLGPASRSAVEAMEGGMAQIAKAAAQA